MSQDPARCVTDGCWGALRSGIVEMLVVLFQVKVNSATERSCAHIAVKGPGLRLLRRFGDQGVDLRVQARSPNVRRFSDRFAEERRAC